jgi:CubicO group peptidase (beta-lactamase class C family)
MIRSLEAPLGAERQALAGYRRRIVQQSNRSAQTACRVGADATWKEKTTTRWFGPLVLAVLVGAAAGVVGQAHPQTIDTIFKDFATDQSPGCAIGAARGDAPLAAKAYGMADLEHNIPLTPQSVFYMASVSKQFTALSILLLERDGKLLLEDRVRTYLPELPDYAAGITIRQLLHHTSGLRDYLTLSGLAGNLPDQVTTERGNRSAESNTLAVCIDFHQRDELIAEEPKTYYLTDHYVTYPCVLVRLSRIREDALRDLLLMGWRFMSTTKPRQARRRRRKGQGFVAG